MRHPDEIRWLHVQIALSWVGGVTVLAWGAAHLLTGGSWWAGSAPTSIRMLGGCIALGILGCEIARTVVKRG